jgi:hypothetical protein
MQGDATGVSGFAVVTMTGCAVRTPVTPYSVAAASDRASSARATRDIVGRCR